MLQNKHNFFSISKVKSNNFDCDAVKIFTEKNQHQVYICIEDSERAEHLEM